MKHSPSRKLLNLFSPLCKPRFRNQMRGNPSNFLTSIHS